MEFGKDYRLVGEATLTGEKYRAGKKFWFSLAHTDIIGRIKPIVEHYGIVGEYIDKPFVYDRDELIAWLTARSANCLCCYNYVTPQGGRDHLRFRSEFFGKMKEIGLGWEEFQLYCETYLNRYFLRHPEPNDQDWDEKAIFMHEKFNNQYRPDNLFYRCIGSKEFVDILDMIAANRRWLQELPVAK